METVMTSKPEELDSRGDALSIYTWLYQVDQYLNLLQVTNPEVAIDNNVKDSFASTLFKGNAAKWWFMLVQAEQAPGQWKTLKACVHKTAVPQESVRRSRDQRRELV